MIMHGFTPCIFFFKNIFKNCKIFLDNFTELLYNDKTIIMELYVPEYFFSMPKTAEKGRKSL